VLSGSAFAAPTASTLQFVNGLALGGTSLRSRRAAR
jgi:hypothetical protein